MSFTAEPRRSEAKAVSIICVPRLNGKTKYLRTCLRPQLGMMDKLDSRLERAATADQVESPRAGRKDAYRSHGIAGRFKHFRPRRVVTQHLKRQMRTYDERDGQGSEPAEPKKYPFHISVPKSAL
jgi:hypothetical protein